MHLSCIFALVGLVSQIVSVSTTPIVSEPGPVNGTTSHYATVRSRTYHYLRSRPIGEPKATILLLHGYPDLAYGWRYQIPHLSSLGYQVIVPDMLGYADTSSPSELRHWTLKEMSTDLALLLDQVVPPSQKMVLGGHDWGALLAYKFVLWYPELFQAMFTLNIPLEFTPLPTTEFQDVPELVSSGIRPTLAYQLQFRDNAFDRRFQTESQMRQLLNAAYGGLTPDGRSAVSAQSGFSFDLFPTLQPTTLMPPSDLDFYVEKYVQRGIRGAQNWYRTNRMNWEDEQPILLQRQNSSSTNDSVYPRYSLPSLFVPAAKDEFILPEYYANMTDYFDQLTIADAVDSGHWMMQEKPDEVNTILQDWIGSLF